MTPAKFGSSRNKSQGTYIENQTNLDFHITLPSKGLAMKKIALYKC